MQQTVYNYLEDELSRRISEARVNANKRIAVNWSVYSTERVKKYS